MAQLSESPGLRKGSPGNRIEGDDLAPVFRLEVNDIPLLSDINQFISSVEYESAIGMADMLRILIDNPGLVDDQYPNWAEHKAFEASSKNEASLFIGYGGRADKPENFVGRVQWTKQLPSYPREGMPQLELKGYDASHNLMDNTGPISVSGGVARMDRKRPLDSADNQGQVFARIRHSEVVESIASMNGFDVDIDPTERQEDVALKKGSKHYEIVKGLANLNNREFWVDYSLKKRKWILHWKKIQRDEMRPGFVFRYNHGDEGTLLEANPEYGLRETVNSATILVFDDKAHRWVSVGEFHDIEGSTDPKFTKGGGLVARSTASKNTRAAMKKKRSKSEAKRQSQMKKDVNTIKEAMDSPSAYRIAASGFAIDVLPPPGRRFKNSEEASRWMLRWFQAKQDNFITVSGTVIGVESLRARQIHTLKGLSSRLDGNYYFTRVRHRPDANDGYYCEFTANRVVTG